MSYRSAAVVRAAAGTKNVLWAILPQPESDDAYHIGADVSLLSQFSHEAEILYVRSPLRDPHALAPRSRSRLKPSQNRGTHPQSYVRLSPHTMSGCMTDRGC